MQMPGRHGSLSGANYRYKFNGMEADGEVAGEGNSYTTQFRQYDPRLGRWKSLDPLAGKYPGQSPFAGFNNNPIYFVDPLGLEGSPNTEGGSGGEQDGKKNSSVGKEGEPVSGWKKVTPDGVKPYREYRTSVDTRIRIHAGDQVSTWNVDKYTVKSDLGTYEAEIVLPCKTSA